MHHISNNIITLVCFAICFATLKPWQRKLSFNQLIALLCFDIFALYDGINLHFYKIFSLFYIVDIIKKDNYDLIKNHFLFFSFTILSGLTTAFIIFTAQTSNDFLLTDVFQRIFRHCFTLGSSFLFSFALYKSLKDKNKINFLQSFYLIGLVLSMSIFLEVLFKFDFFSFFTNGLKIHYGQSNPLTQTYLRARGFSYEPRGAALILTISILGILLHLKKIDKFFYILIPTMALAFTYTRSFSGVIALTAGLFIILFLKILKKNTKLIPTLYVMTSFSLAMIISNLYNSPSLDKTNSLASHAKARFYIIPDSEAFKNCENISSLFEVFDSTYVNFICNNPRFIFLGNGAGTSAFLSKKYILERDKIFWPNGSLNLPHMGIFYFVSNFGIFLTAYLILIVIKNIRTNKGLTFVSLFSLISFVQATYLLVFCFLLLLQPSLKIEDSPDSTSV